jgi:hypothetical protein
VSALAWTCGGALPRHTISGTISGDDGGVVIALGGASTGITQPDVSGRYSFSSLPPGTYTLTPSSLGTTFTPSTITLTVADGDVPGQDFSANLHLSGRISGVAAGGVTVNLGGAAVRTTTTDSLGRFAFDELPDGAYTVSPMAAIFSFTPSHREVTTSRGSFGGVDFIATPPSSPFSVRIEGDAASGVQAGTWPGEDGPSPRVDVAGYDPVNDPWTVSIRFDTDALFGLGGVISFKGRPAVATFTESSPGLVTSLGQRPRGDGRCLLEHGQSGVACIALPDPASIALHERMGFRPVGTLPGGRPQGWCLGAAWHGGDRTSARRRVPPPPREDPAWGRALSRRRGALSTRTFSIRHKS